MKFDKNILKLYAVTDRTWTGKKSIYEQIESAIKGGVTCVQLREKKLSHDEFLKEALEIKKICQKYNIPLLINDNVKIAIACDADGIHVGQNDMTVKKVRELVGDKMILGVSTQTIEQAISAEKDGADYLGVGAVFASSTKPEANIIPHERLKKIAESVKIPVVAIGGIQKHNIIELARTGIAGVALISAIFSKKNIEKECNEILESVSLMLKNKN